MKIIEESIFGFMETSALDSTNKNLKHSSNKVKDKIRNKKAVLEELLFF
jgi:hypothetical protein